MALVGELCRSAIADTEDDVLLWRVNVREEDEGMAVILQLRCALSAVTGGKVEMALNSRCPVAQARPRLVSVLHRRPAEGKAGEPASGQPSSASSRSPRDRAQVPVIDVHGLHNSHSVGLMAVLEALIRESKDGARLLTVLSMEPIDDAAKAWMSPPLK